MDTPALDERCETSQDETMNHVLDLFKAEMYHEAAEMYMGVLEQLDGKETVLSQSCGRKDIAMRLGYEMTQDPFLYERLKDVFPKLSAQEKTSVGFLLPDMMKTVYEGDSLRTYVCNLGLLGRVCQAGSVEEVVQYFDTCNAMNVHPLENISLSPLPDLPGQ